MKTNDPETAHVVFVWRKGRRWRYVCVTCEAREHVTYSRHAAIDQAREHHPYITVYDNALRKVTIGEPVLF